MIRPLAVIALLWLGGCAGLIAAGSAAGAIGGGLAVADQLVGTVDATIRAACGEYEKGRAVAEALIATGLVPLNAIAKARLIEEYGDAACANPPQGDPLLTAIWLGELVGQIAALTSARTVAP
ncbi:MAG TPA: hypothetical protein VN808_16700 [Stellaceae bacterium]|nr:hypothetical protein [Stellaceae bacterium]